MNTRRANAERLRLNFIDEINNNPATVQREKIPESRRARAEKAREAYFSEKNAGTVASAREQSSEERRARAERARVSYFAEEFLSSRRAELKEELNALKKTGPGMKPYEMDAATYLYRCAVDYDPIEGAELERYRAAEETRVETLAQLPHGRGNVLTDISKTEHKSSRQVCMAQELQGGLLQQGIFGIKTWAATAQFIGAGNCDERGSLAAINHIKRLAPGREIDRVYTSIYDHGWMIEREKAGEVRPYDLYIDAWTYGPVVHAKNARFSHQPEHIISYYKYNQHSGPIALQEHQKLLQSLRDNPVLQIWSDTRLQELNDMSYTVSFYFRAHRSESQSFLERTSARNELLAAGVARSMGENIKDAVKKVPSILDAVANPQFVDPKK